MLIYRNFFFDSQERQRFYTSAGADQICCGLSSGKELAVTAVRLHEGSRGAGAVDRWRQRPVCEVWNSALEIMQINEHTRGIHLLDHAACESLDSGRVVGNSSLKVSNPRCAGQKGKELDFRK
jgi:hypothetical protein